MSEYVPYKIGVEPAESWMDRPIKVSFETRTPNGSTSQAIYLDEAERDALIRALGGVVSEEPEWEYGVGWRWNHFVYAFSTGTRDAAEEHIGRHPDDADFGPHFLVRREPERSAGPWVPAEQGDET